MNSGVIIIICLLIVCDDITLCIRIGDTASHKASPNKKPNELLTEYRNNFLKKSLEQTRPSGTNDTSEKKVDSSEQFSQKNGYGNDKTDKEGIPVTNKVDEKVEKKGETEGMLRKENDHAEIMGLVKIEKEGMARKKSDQAETAGLVKIDTEKAPETKFTKDKQDARYYHDLNTNGYGSPDSSAHKNNPNRPGKSEYENENKPNKDFTVTIHSNTRNSGDPAVKIPTEAKGYSKDGNRQSDYYEKPYKKDKPDTRDLDTLLNINHPDAKKPNREGKEGNYYRKPKVNQYKPSKTEASKNEDFNKESLKAIYGDSDNNVNIESGSKKHSEFGNSEGKGDVKPSDARSNKANTNEISAAYGKTAKGTKLEFDIQTDERNMEETETPANKDIKQDEFYRGSSGSKNSENDVKTGVQNHVSPTEEEEVEKKVVNSKDKHGPFKLLPEGTESPENHSGDVAQTLNTNEVQPHGDGPIFKSSTVTESTKTTTPLVTHISVIEKTASPKRTHTSHSTTVFRFQTSATVKTKQTSSIAAITHRSTAEINREPKLNPIDEFICQRGYSKAALVTGIVGGMIMGGGLVFLLFYCKRRCSKYMNGDYRPVPLEYDFELNPRFKTT